MQPVDHRVAARSRPVGGWEIDGDLSHMRIAQGIAAEGFARKLFNDHGAASVHSSASAIAPSRESMGRIHRLHMRGYHRESPYERAGETGLQAKGQEIPILELRPAAGEGYGASPSIRRRPVFV